MLADLAASIGLDRHAALAMLDSGARAGVVRQKAQDWTRLGIQSVPAMVFLGRHLVTGAQGEDTYTRILHQLREMRAA